MITISVSTLESVDFYLFYEVNNSETEMQWQ